MFVQIDKPELLYALYNKIMIFQIHIYCEMYECAIAGYI